jgi:hypothetical protein
VWSMEDKLKCTYERYCLGGWRFWYWCHWVGCVYVDCCDKVVLLGA